MSEFEKWFNDNFGDEYLHYEEAVWNYQQQKIDKLKKDALELAEFYGDNWFKMENKQLVSRMYEDQGRKAQEFLAKYKNESKDK